MFAALTLVNLYAEPMSLVAGFDLRPLNRDKQFHSLGMRSPAETPLHSDRAPHIHVMGMDIVDVDVARM